MVNNWLRDRRDKLHISQETLAARLQEQGFPYSAGTISHWERGRYKPPMNHPEFRQALASVLKMSVPAMLLAAGYEATPHYSEDAMHAADIVDQLPDDKRRLALGILEQILEGV
jgi:transcriptional regulator with XRE-family HTH domain